MTDNTEREAFEKVCPVPEFLQRDATGYTYKMNGGRNPAVFKEYNALWQGFLLGRAQDAEVRKDAARLDWLEDCGKCYWLSIQSQPHGKYIRNSQGVGVRAAIDAAISGSETK